MGTWSTYVERLRQANVPLVSFVDHICDPKAPFPASIRAERMVCTVKVCLSRLIRSFQEPHIILPPSAYGPNRLGPPSLPSFSLTFL